MCVCVCVCIHTHTYIYIYIYIYIYFKCSPSISKMTSLLGCVVGMLRQQLLSMVPLKVAVKPNPNGISEINQLFDDILII